MVEMPTFFVFVRSAIEIWPIVHLMLSVESLNFFPPLLMSAYRLFTDTSGNAEGQGRTLKHGNEKKVKRERFQ